MLSAGYSENQFLTSKNNCYTYSDFRKFIYHFSSFLKKEEFKNSRPIGLLTKSSDKKIFIMAACWELGLPFVCFNPNGKKQILNIQIEALNPAIIFTDQPDLKNEKKANFKDIQSISLKTILDSSKVQSAPFYKPKEIADDLIFGYFFTSGTTAEPKIVPLKRRQILTAAHSSSRNLKPRVNKCWLLCMPLHHIGGASIIVRSLLYCSSIYRLGQFNTDTVSKLLSTNKQITAVSLVPTMLSRLLADTSFAPHSRFKAVLLGGGPIPALLVEECLERNIPIIASYGMTETCAQIAAQTVESSTDAAQSVGPVFKPNSIEIRDNNRQNIGTDKSGTIWLKGPQVFDGYYNKNDQNNFDENDWFNSGDFGRLDNNERLYIESRRTDLIVTGGENVSPFEVEEALRKIGAIQDAAVTGLVNEKWGQIVAAVVVIKQNHKMSSSKIKARLSELLQGFKIPKKILIVTSIPKTKTGKIKRRKLQKLLCQ